MRTLLTGLAVGTAALVLALPAGAETLTLKDGTFGGMPWKLTAAPVRRARARRARRPCA
jgi:hypothetical protein